MEYLSKKYETQINTAQSRYNQIKQELKFLRLNEFLKIIFSYGLPDETQKIERLDELSDELRNKIQIMQRKPYDEWAEFSDLALVKEYLFNSANINRLESKSNKTSKISKNLRECILRQNALEREVSSRTYTGKSEIVQLFNPLVNGAINHVRAQIYDYKLPFNLLAKN